MRSRSKLATSELLESRRLLSIVLVKDLIPGFDSGIPQELTDVGGTLFFRANTGTQGAPSLWKSDGTAAGTVQLKDGFGLPAPQGRIPTGFADINGTLFFSGWDGNLWKSDGTPQGTVRVKELPSPGVGSLREVNDAALFLRRTADGTEQELWRSDGTEAGTVMLKRMGIDTFGLRDSTLTKVGEQVFFAAADADHGYELWRSDGTAAGTYMVKDVLPGRRGGNPAYITDVAGTAFFFHDDPAAGMELWKSDGTEAGTVKVRDIDPIGYVTEAVASGGLLYFVAEADNRSGPGLELWKSDGTEAGTVVVKDIYPGTTGEYANISFPRYLTPSGNGLFFFASTPTTGYELWHTDGTEQGTRMVREIAPGPAHAIPYGDGYEEMVDVDGTVYFTADSRTNGGTGYELWRSDGTEAGTVLVQDMYPGPTGNFVRDMAASGGSLYFAALHPTYGTELFRVPPGPVAATVVGRYVFYNRSSYDGNNAAANAADDAAIATDKNALPADADRLPGFDNITSYDKGINGVMVDVTDLPQDRTLSADDFDFGGAAAPLSVVVRRGAGAQGSDRVTLVWRDYGGAQLPRAVGNGWLTVAVKANANTGLARPDVFSFGNLVGETGDAGGVQGWRVSALDLSAVKRAANTDAAVAAATDFNRDGRTNALDLAIVRRNLNRGLAALAAAPRVVPAPVLTSSASPGWPEAQRLAGQVLAPTSSI